LNEIYDFIALYRQNENSCHINEDVKENINEIWFTRPRGESSEKLNDYSRGLLSYDLSKFILDYQRLQGVKVKYISKKLYQTLSEKVNEGSSPSNSYQPSSGLCILEMVIAEGLQEHYEIFVLGFSWEGWDGHNWKYEKKRFNEFGKIGIITILN